MKILRNFCGTCSQSNVWVKHVFVIIVQYSTVLPLGKIPIGIVMFWREEHASDTNGTQTESDYT